MCFWEEVLKISCSEIPELADVPETQAAEKSKCSQGRTVQSSGKWDFSMQEVGSGIALKQSECQRQWEKHPLPPLVLFHPPSAEQVTIL